MEKEIMLAISGLQTAGEEPDTLETVTAAEYYFRNGHHYVVYEETEEGFQKPTKNILKFDASALEVTRRGNVNVTMRFDKKQKHQTTYQTPFGAIGLEIETKALTIREETDTIHLHTDYVLQADGAQLADCKLHIRLYKKEPPI